MLSYNNEIRLIKIQNNIEFYLLKFLEYVNLNDDPYMNRSIGIKKKYNNSK